MSRLEIFNEIMFEAYCKKAVSHSLLLSILPYCPQSLVPQRIDGNPHASYHFLL